MLSSLRTDHQPQGSIPGLRSGFRSFSQQSGKCRPHLSPRIQPIHRCGGLGAVLLLAMTVGTRVAGSAHKRSMAALFARPRLSLVPPEGGPSVPDLHLDDALILSFLVADVVPDCLLIPAYRRHHVPPRPEVLPGVVSLPLSVHPRQVDRTS